MKQHVVVFVAAVIAVIAAAAAAGCGKSSDLAPMASEANGFVKSFEERGAALDRRAKDLVRRVQELDAQRAIPPEHDSEPARRLLAEVMTVLLPRMGNGVREAPGQIAKLVGDDKLDEARKLEEVRTYAHRIRDGLSRDWLDANAKLDSVEAWLFRAERRPRVQPPTPTPAPEPAQPGADAAGGTLPAGDPGAAGDDAGNAAR